GGDCLAASAALPAAASGREEIVWPRPLRFPRRPPAGRRLFGRVRCASRGGLRQGGDCLAASAALPAAGLRQGGDCLAASAALPAAASGREEIVWPRPLRFPRRPPAGRRLFGRVRCASRGGLRQGGDCLAASAALPAAASGREEIVWPRPLRFPRRPPAGRRLFGRVRCASRGGLRQGGDCLAASAALPRRPPAGRRLFGRVRCASRGGLRQGGDCLAASAALPAAASGREEIVWPRPLRFPRRASGREEIVWP